MTKINVSLRSTSYLNSRIQKKRQNSLTLVTLDHFRHFRHFRHLQINSIGFDLAEQ